MDLLTQYQQILSHLESLCKEETDGSVNGKLAEAANAVYSAIEQKKLDLPKVKK